MRNIILPWDLSQRRMISEGQIITSPSSLYLISVFCFFVLFFWRKYYTAFVNAPGAHRFKIDLTLDKRGVSSSADAQFIELLRLENGIRQNQVRSTEYAILEDTLARRTFDESGDYTVREFDLDIREHLIKHSFNLREKLTDFDLNLTNYAMNLMSWSYQPK
jgi:hypothetical protein